MQTAVNDLRYALRQLRKVPGFALVAILTLALGIGANTAIFSVMNAVLLRMLPVHEPERLFYLTHRDLPAGVSDTGDSRYTYGINVYERMRENKDVFSDVIAYVPLSITKTAVRVGDTPEEAQADEVSGNFFTGLGVPMAAGQPFFAADEDRHSLLAVISYGYWTRRLHRAPDVIGMSIYINGIPFSIVGVTAPNFYGVESGGTATDVWIPLQNRRELNAWGMPASDHTLYGSPNWWTLMLMARLKPGVTEAQAQTRMNPVFIRAAYETVSAGVHGNERLALELVPARGLGTASNSFQQPLRVLMGMVALVLVIACVNIMMLLAARNAVRQREFSLRLALGASRWTLFRQLLMESALLVSAGVVLGWLFAVEATKLLAAWSELDVSLAPDFRVLVFTLLVAAFVALGFGLAPLRAAAHSPVALVLKSSGAQAGAGRERILAGKFLIAAQMALCVALLFGAGLLIRTLRNYRHVDLGMQAQSVLAFGVHPIGTSAGSEMIAFYTRLLERLQELPEIKSATLAGNRPGGGWSDNSTPVVDGRSYSWDNGRNDLRTNTVGPDFFRTLGIPLVAGRDIQASDTKTSTPIVVVNQTFADMYLHGHDALGHQLGDKQRFTIVGVAKDSKYTSADEEALPMAWYSYQQQQAIPPMDVEVRTAGDPLTLLPSIRRIVREMDPNAPLSDPRVLQSQFEETYVFPALFARLATFFGGLAALLVTVGLYGTLAYRVNRRTIEIGVRMALGAQRAQVLWMVLRDSLVLVFAGVVVGLPLAWFGSKLMASMLYQLSAHDPVSFVAAGVGVLIVSVLAALLPARRAASIDPMQALRTE